MDRINTFETARQMLIMTALLLHLGWVYNLRSCA